VKADVGACRCFGRPKLFVVPTIAFQQLFAFLVLGYERRRLLWFAVTRNPTAEWLARQITKAFPWDSAPKYLIRDNDRAFGVAFKARVRSSRLRESLYVPARTPSNCHHITFEQAQARCLVHVMRLILSSKNLNKNTGLVPSRRHIVGTICATRDDLEVA
jgi:hypothetical protein